MYSTLFPFDFVNEGTSFLGVLRSFRLTAGATWKLRGAPANVLLFAPLGAGVGAATHASSRAVRRWAPLAGGLLLSVALEFVQSAWLLREPAVDDVVANTVGAALGGWCWFRYGDRLRARVRGLRSRPRRWVTPAAWSVLSLAPTVFLVVATSSTADDSRLASWDAEYPLVLGNEPSGDRPWRGSISELTVTDRAVSRHETADLISGTPVADVAPESIVVDADFDHRADPPVGWEVIGPRSRGADAAVSGDGFHTGPEHWLQAADARDDIERIRSSSEFTVSIRATPDSSHQTGPARLLSISSDSADRNVTIAQDGRDLVVRVRSDVTGANASLPEFVVPDVFEQQRTQRLVISYDSSTVRVGVDDPRMIAELELLPATFPLLELFTDDIHRLRFSSVGDEIRRASLAVGMFGAWMSSLAISYGSGRVGRRWLFASVVPVACAELVLSRSAGTVGIAAGSGAGGAVALGALVLVITSALGLRLRARRTGDVASA